MKTFLKEFWRFISKPKMWFCIMSIICALAFSGLSLACVFMGNSSEWWTYPIYALAATSSFCATLACIHYAKHFREIFRLVVGRYAFTEEVYANKGYRMKVFSSVALLIGLLYTIFLIVMAVMDSSFWYASLAEYNAVFCLTRFFVLNEGRIAKKLPPIKAEKKRTKAYALSGILIILVGVQFAFSLMNIVFRGETFRYAGMMIYVFALVVFIKLPIAIVRIVKIKERDDTTVRSIICYNLAGASVSLVALQTAMFDAFGAEAELSVPIFNAITGGAVCFFLIALGVMMIVTGRRAYKRLEKYENG